MSIRDVILETTLHLVAKRGISATSLQDIADASSCSKANVLYHFSHKEQLIDEALAPTLSAVEKLVSATAIKGLGSDDDRVAFAQNLVELLVSHRRAAHIVITHPYLVESVPALKKVQALMGQLADLVAHSSSGEYDRIRFGIVMSGVTYTLVSASILELELVPEDDLATMLTDAVTSMVMSAPLAAEASR